MTPEPTEHLDPVGTPAPDRPGAVGPSPMQELPPAESVELHLPPEFSGKDPRSTEDGPQSGQPAQAGTILEVPRQAPAPGLPGDSISDSVEEIAGLDGPVYPGFENYVSIRTAAEREPPPELTYIGSKQPPTRSAAFVFGYRQFSISDGLKRQQDWHIASIEVTPLRRYFRLNLLTELGFEGGEAAQAGDRADLLLMEKLGLGLQYPHWVSPFIEFQTGIGAARVELFERNDLAIVTSVGIDVGAQWAMAKHFFLLAAVGWIRPVFKVGERRVYYDRMAFKVGFGF